MEEHKTQAGKPEEQIFYDAFRASPIGIAVEDLEGRPLFVNPAFCSFLGFSEEELRNKHCVEFSPREDAQKDWALFQQLRAGVIDHYQLEKRYFRRDGSLVWGRLSISLLKSRPSPLVLAMVEDITEKKRAEEVRFRHSAIVESSEDAIISKNLDAVIVSWNAGAQRIFGYTEAEAVGQPITILIPPELQDEEKKILEKLRAGEGIEHYETMRVKKTGIKINVSLTISPIRDSTGRTVGFSKIARDISERKLAEEALRASEERLRLAQQAARIGTFEWDIQTGVNTWTPEMEEMYGLPMGGFGGTQTAFENLVHPDDRTGVIKLVDAAMKSGQPTKGEWRVVWADGSVHWIAGCWQVFMDASGEPSKMIGVNIDVTDRKRAEGALLESEERYRLAAQAGRMYAFDWDVVTDVIIRSEESTHIFGLTAEPIKLTKRELLARVHAEDRATFINSIVECTPESPNTQISYRLLRPDGSVLWLERTGHAFFDEQGRMVRMVGMVTDITERKLAENKLQEYERAVEGLEEMMVVVDREYRYLIANNKFLTIRNMTKEQVVGRFAHEVLNKGVFEAVVKEKLDECFQGKVVRYEMKYTYPELGERDIFVSYFPIEGVTGVDRVACIAQDITERKRAEEALSTVSQKLMEGQEEERTRIAMELHDDVGQRLSLLAVHLDRLKQSRPASAAELGLQIEEVRKQIDDLASDVQALSHQLHSPKLDYLGLAAAAASFCRELSDRHGMEIEFHSENIPKELPKEISLCLFRVLQEALQNAIKHSGSRQFHTSLTGGANEIELTVHDSGVGFEPEEAIKGRGLGLTSTKERLKLVQGKLSIDSKPQRGTTIHARVPVIPKTMSAGAVG